VKQISFVIPCYRSENTIKSVVAEIQETMQNSGYKYEIILICDHSPDNVYEIIIELAHKNNNIKGMEFTKNFGQHAALMAGYRVASGDIIVSLDDDGQTPANSALALISKIEEGYDVVYASYKNKKHSRFRNWGSRVNDHMAEWLINKPHDIKVSSYFAMTKTVCQEIVRYKNPYPYVLGLVLRSSVSICNVDVIHRERQIGVSGYSLKKLIALWLNGFTAFSVKPLRLATIIGFGTSLCGFLFTIYIVLRKLVYPNIPTGYSSLMAVQLFTGGMILMCLGLIGEYVGRIYISLNNSPQYVIRDTVNIHESK